MLQKTGEAKEKNQEATALEKVKTEVAGSYNLEGKIDLSQLKTNLKRLNIPDEDITPTIKDEKETFPVKVKINNYEYDILEDATVEKPIDFATLESLYGKVVNNYTGYEATDVTEWKLLYVDEENRDAIIIASNIVAITLDTKPYNSEIEYEGSKNLEKFEYGLQYNRIWLGKNKKGNGNISSKFTAFLCDPDNWKQYKYGKARYAAGGPTVEIMVASSYEKQISNIDIYNNVTDNGYIGAFCHGLVDRRKNQLYNFGVSYELASPGGSEYRKILVASQNCIGDSGTWNSPSASIRPIVCLPASAIEVVGEGDNAILNYK